MKILFVGADKNNPTDGVIVKGIFNLLNLNKIKYSYDYYFLNDNEILKENSFPTRVYDYIIVCGTPWIWDQFHRSIKYSNLLQIIKYHKKSKIMFLGIGSCIGLDHLNSKICETNEEQKGMQVLFENACVITRDKLCHDKLQTAKIKSYFLPCPSYFCYEIENDYSAIKTENVMIWCDPQKTIAQVDWQKTEKLQEYYRIFTDFFAKFNPKVYCAFDNEKTSAIKIGLPEPIVLSGWQNTLDIMKTANHVLSGRIHCAVPAVTAGKKTCVVKIDSRYMTISDFNGYAISNIVDLNFVAKKIDLHFYSTCYKNIFDLFFQSNF